MTREDSQSGIGERLASLRLELAGPRGKSLFAKQLGISPSTYAYYEGGRTPPAEVLVRIADLTGVDLRWLLTGDVAEGAPAPADHPAVRRAAALLGANPAAAGPLAAFLDVLAESMKFPDKGLALGEAAATDEDVVAEQAQASWIPVLGRSAAGVPQFWADGDSAAGVPDLGELAARYARSGIQRVTTARAAAEADPDDQGTVQVISLTAPDEHEVVSYVAAAAIKARYPEAFAVRIDGESMAPHIRHGDLVVLSPSEPAADGHAAVVQLQRQIGVTCKLFRREAHAVHLIPINEQFPPQAFAGDQLVWALRVLARVRIDLPARA